MYISTLSTIAIPDQFSAPLISGSITLLTPSSPISKALFPLFPQPKKSESESQSRNFPIAHLPPELRTHIYTPYLQSLPCVVVTASNICLPLQSQLPLLQSSPFFTSDIADSLLWRNVQLGFEDGDVLRRFLREKGEVSLWVQRVRVIVRRRGADCDWVFLILGGLKGVKEITFGFENWEAEEGDWERDWEERENWWEGVCDAVREGVAGRDRKKGGLVLRADMGVGGVREVVC